MMTSTARITMSILLVFSGIFVDCPQAQEISDIKSPRLRALAAGNAAGMQGQSPISSPLFHLRQSSCRSRLRY